MMVSWVKEEQRCYARWSQKQNPKCRHRQTYHKRFDFKKKGLQKGKKAIFGRSAGK